MTRRTLVFDAFLTCTGDIDRLVLPDISNRDIWDNLDYELKRNIIKQAEDNLDKEWPQILITDFMEFRKNGNRVNFENKNFTRRYILNSMVMAECVENKGRFMDKILEGLYLILEESSWCLPAHNSYERDARQYALPDVTRPIIDLFDAESGAEVAIAEYLLRPVLNDLCPFISKYVNDMLEKRIFTPYLEQHFWWMGDGVQQMLNWTVWCTQNVLLAALSRQEDTLSDNRLRNILLKASKSTDYFMDEYGEDGCCDEGAQYYGHAGLCMFNCIDLLNQATGGKISNLFNNEIVKNIGSYIVKMYVGNRYYINYADCSPLAGRRGAREFLFGLATNQEALAGFAAKDYRESDWNEKLLVSEINLYYHVKQILNHSNMMNYDKESGSVEDVYFKSTGIMISRDEHFTLAAKAGDNADSHNHNDVGSITLYKDNEPILIDLGVGTYTQKTFSDKRYEIPTMQSQYHNLPTFYEQSAIVSAMDRALDKDVMFKIMQHDGEQYAAKDVECTLEKDCSYLKMDISGAYGCDKLKSYVRKAALIKNSHVEISDSFEGELTAVLSMMTYFNPELLKYGGDFADVAIGNKAVMHVEGIKEIKIEEFPIEDERLGQMWKHNCYRILLELSSNTFNAIIK
ncbi:MAG: heparinase II/III-family protein [Butyrivibrio sp.]|nr:heparinase II/III-family protein [Butyrivibrio sp.]